MMDWDADQQLLTLVMSSCHGDEIVNPGAAVDHVWQEDVWKEKLLDLSLPCASCKEAGFFSLLVWTFTRLLPPTH